MSMAGRRRTVRPSFSGLAPTARNSSSSSSTPVEAYFQFRARHSGKVIAGARVTLTFHFWSGARATYYVT